MSEHDAGLGAEPSLGAARGTDPAEVVEAAPWPVPLPSLVSSPPVRTTSRLTPLICDERAIARLLETVLARGGLSVRAASKALGVTTNTIRQYLHGRRSRPSLIWFVRLANLCGTSVLIEYPGAPVADLHPASTVGSPERLFRPDP